MGGERRGRGSRREVSGRGEKKERKWEGKWEGR